MMEVRLLTLNDIDEITQLRVLNSMSITIKIKILILKEI